MGSEGGPWTHGKIPKFCKQETDEDVETFLMSFEDHMTNCSVPKEQWPAHLVPVLHSRVRRVHAALGSETWKDFDLTREALLKHFNVTRETYRKKMDTLKKRPDDSWVMHFCEYRRWSCKWTADCTTLEEMGELYDAETIECLDICQHGSGTSRLLP